MHLEWVFSLEQNIVLVRAIDPKADPDASHQTVSQHYTEDGTHPGWCSCKTSQFSEYMYSYVCVAICYHIYSFILDICNPRVVGALDSSRRLGLHGRIFRQILPRFSPSNKLKRLLGFALKIIPPDIPTIIGMTSGSLRSGIYHVLVCLVLIL